MNLDIRINGTNDSIIVNDRIMKLEYSDEYVFKLCKDKILCNANRNNLGKDFANTIRKEIDEFNNDELSKIGFCSFNFSWALTVVNFILENGNQIKNVS